MSEINCNSIIFPLLILSLQLSIIQQLAYCLLVDLQNDVTKFQDYNVPYIAINRHDKSKYYARSILINTPYLGCSCSNL